MEQHGVGKSLQSALACDGGARTLFLFVRAVEVFEGLKFFGSLNCRAQVIRQFPLLLDACDDFLLPLDEAAQVGEARFHLTQHLVLKRAGRLLAVACDEWDCVAVVEKRDDGCNLLRTDGEFARNGGGYIGDTHGTKPFFLLFNVLHYNMISKRRKRIGYFSAAGR